MEDQGFEFKHIFFAGVGAIAMTVEKTRDLVRELIEKGEMTVEQGAIINEELKRNIGSKMRSAANAVDPQKSPTVVDMLQTMSREELDAVKAKLEELEKEEQQQAQADGS